MKHISRIIFLCSLFSIGIAQAIDLDELNTIATAGAVDLAAKLMASQDEPSPESIDEWLRWQQFKIELLRKRRDWLGVSKILQSMPTDFPPALELWRKQELANAYLELNEGGKARRLLRALLWTLQRSPEADIRHWRVQIMRSYLLEKNPSDANSAMLKFRQDYGSDELESSGLREKINLALGRVKQPTPDAVIALGQEWKISPNRASEIRHKLKLMLAEEDLSAAQRLDAWSLLEQIARANLDLGGRVEALENQLMTSTGTVATKLRDAYFEMAQSAGNQTRLLMGDDAAWMRLGDEQLRIDARLARAVFAQLADKAGTEKIRVQAYLRLAESMEMLDPTRELLYQFFNGAPPLERAMVLPQALGYLQVDSLYRHKLFGEAVQIMEGQDRLPAEADPVDWSLARARTYLTVSKPGPAAEVLVTMLENSPTLDDIHWQWLDQLLIEFAVARAEGAIISVGNAMLLQDLDVRKTRGLLYLIGEAHSRQGQHQQAARRFLYAAGYVDPGETDSWAQLARARAADSLVEAGLVDDALALYRNLLATAQSEAQQWKLRRSIQQILVARRGTKDASIGAGDQGQ